MYLLPATCFGAPHGEFGIMNFDAIYGYLINASKIFLLGWPLLLLLTFAVVFGHDPWRRDP